MRSGFPFLRLKKPRKNERKTMTAKEQKRMQNIRNQSKNLAQSLSEKFRNFKIKTKELEFFVTCFVIEISRMTTNRTKFLDSIRENLGNIRFEYAPEGVFQYDPLPDNVIPFPKPKTH